MVKLNILVATRDELRTTLKIREKNVEKIIARRKKGLITSIADIKDIFNNTPGKYEFIKEVACASGIAAGAAQIRQRSGMVARGKVSVSSKGVVYRASASMSLSSSISSRKTVVKAASKASQARATQRRTPASKSISVKRPKVETLMIRERTMKVVKRS